MIKKPLNIDPSRTKNIRRAFDIKANAVLRMAKNRVMAALDAPDWVGKTKQDKINDIKRRVRDGGKVIRGDIRAYKTDRWYETFVDKATRRGLERAWAEGRDLVAGETDEQRMGAQRFFVKEAMRMHQEDIDLRKDKALSDLQGITDHLVTTINREVSDVIRRGGTKKEITKTINRIFKKVQTQRMHAFVSVTTIGAHAEAQLDGWEQLGYKLVGLRAEWKTAGDKKVCPKCKKMEGRVFTIKQARGKIPLHIACRCAWILIRKNKGK